MERSFSGYKYFCKDLYALLQIKVFAPFSDIWHANVTEPCGSWPFSDTGKPAHQQNIILKVELNTNRNQIRTQPHEQRQHRQILKHEACKRTTQGRRKWHEIYSKFGFPDKPRAKVYNLTKVLYRVGSDVLCFATHTEEKKNRWIDRDTMMIFFKVSKDADVVHHRKSLIFFYTNCDNTPIHIRIFMS